MRRFPEVEDRQQLRVPGQAEQRRGLSCPGPGTTARTGSGGALRREWPRRALPALFAQQPCRGVHRQIGGLFKRLTAEVPSVGPEQQLATLPASEEQPLGNQPQYRHLDTGRQGRQEGPVCRC